MQTDIRQILLAYPVATISTAVFYVFCLLAFHPRWRAFVTSKFSHPIPPTGDLLLGFDTLRGFAASYVAVGHCWYFTYPLFAPSQWTIPSLAFNSKAVPMFVMLSGFLLYRSMLTIEDLAGIRRYISRRFFRIYPIYLLSVILCLAFGQIVTDFPKTGSVSFFVSELMMFRALGFPVFANPVTWSLYVEITFYAVLPLFFICFGRRHILLASTVALIALVVADQQPIREFYLWKYFFFGILSSEISLKYASRLKPWSAAAIFLVGVVMVWLDLLGPRYDWAYLLGLVKKNEAEITLGLGIGFSLVLSALPYTPIAPRLLNIFPLRFIGTISYSIFIIHPFYIIANFPEIQFRTAGTLYEHFKSLPMMPSWYMFFVFVPGILLWSSVAFLLVERPGLMLARRGRTQTTRHASAVAPVAGLGKTTAD